MVDHAFDSRRTSKETDGARDARRRRRSTSSSSSSVVFQNAAAARATTTTTTARASGCAKVLQEEMLFRATASDRACVECDSKETTGGSWLRSKRHPGKYLCFNCYSRELSNVSNKRCASCRAEKTGQKWYKSKGRDETIGAGAKYLCRRCYEKERLALMKGTKSCSTCSTRTTAGRWCKSKTAAGADLCRKCYGKELKDAATKERIQRVDDELEKIRLAISG